MKPRSHSLNHVVCVTITAIAAVPTTSVQRMATTWSDRRASDILIPAPGSWFLVPSEGLADAEVHPDAALLRRAVHEKAFDWIELVPDVEARRTDGRLIADAWAHRVAQVADIEIPRISPDISEVEKRRRPELPSDGNAELGRALEHRQSADRETETAERAHLVASPAADVRCAAQEIALVER